MIIQVTQEHIKRGRKGWAGECPVALALQEAGFKGASVCDVTIGYAMGRGRYHMQPSPQSVRKFIAIFDKSKRKAKPFNFRFNRVK